MSMNQYGTTSDIFVEEQRSLTKNTFFGDCQGNMGTKRKLLNIFLDLFILLIVFLPWIVLHSIGVPFKRGFFCDDESIKYPYRDSTVTNAVMTITGLLLAFFTFCIVELVIYFHARLAGAPLIPTRCGRLSIPAFIISIYSACVVFLFGAAVQQTVVNIAKFSVGRLRPHFLDVCNPNYATINCTLDGSVDKLYRYVTGGDEICNPAANQERLKDARLSFPSGHSSFSMFVAVLLGLYVHSKLTWGGCRLIKHCLQAAMLYAAVFVCVSRVSDYKHHWSDVLAGAFTGVIVAVLTVLYVSNWFRRTPRLDELSNDSMLSPN